MEIQKQTIDDLAALLETCVTRLGHTEGKRYFSLLISKAENEILNTYEKKKDIMLDVEGRFRDSNENSRGQEKKTETEIEELPVINEQDDIIPVLEAI